MTPQELFNERKQLIEDTIALKETSRVVNAVRVNYWPYLEYGMTLADALRDYERGNECFIRFHKEFAPDVGSSCASNYPSKVYELAGLKTVRWPGDPKGLDVNAPYQFIEFETMMEDEYDEFFDAPSHFAINKFLPRTAEIFNPLVNLNWQKMCTGTTSSIAAFTSPEMLAMYKKLEECAEVLNDWRMHTGNLKKTLMEMGYPFISGTSSATAFDMLADSLRCTMGFFADLLLQPENVKRALDIFVEYHIQGSIAMSKATGCPYAWVMLHKAFDGFISDETYAEYYWPYLRKWIIAMVDAGLTPVVFTEGPYNSRLKYLSDVPPGKVIYHFEEVDFRKVKAELGGIACVMGGYSNQSLMFDTPEKVSDKVKEILDIMAPGGGYMFGAAASIDMAPRANMEALFCTLQDYGKY